MATPSVRVLQLLAQLLEDWRVPTDAEKAVFQSFNGFGADANQILKGEGEIEQSLAVICGELNLDKEEVHRAFHQSVLTSFFTPDGLVKTIVDALPPKRYSNILEPSAGTGRFVDRLKDSAKANKHSVSITAIEKEPISSLIMRAIQAKDPAVQVSILRIKTIVMPHPNLMIWSSATSLLATIKSLTLLSKAQKSSPLPKRYTPIISPKALSISRMAGTWFSLPLRGLWTYWEMKYR